MSEPAIQLPYLRSTWAPGPKPAIQGALFPRYRVCHLPNLSFIHVSAVPKVAARSVWQGGCRSHGSDAQNRTS